MRIQRLATMAGLAIVLAATTAACAKRSGAGRDITSAETTTSIVIDNRSFSEMVIYVLEGSSVRRRIGTAIGMAKTRLTIPRSLVGNGRELQFLADPVGSSSTAVSQRMWVTPGDQVGLMIAR
jgi:predicted small secreted protein